MIALLALGPGARADMDLFAAYYNNVARAAAANDAATVARLVAGEGSKANAVDDSGRTGLQNRRRQRQPANCGDPDQGRRQREPERHARQYRAACRDRAQPDRDCRAADRCRRRSQQREQERNDAADDRGSAGQCRFSSRRCSRKERTSARPTSPAATRSVGLRKAAVRRWCKRCSGRSRSADWPLGADKGAGLPFPDQIGRGRGPSHGTVRRRPWRAFASREGENGVPPETGDPHFQSHLLFRRLRGSHARTRASTRRDPRAARASARPGSRGRQRRGDARTPADKTGRRARPA